MLLGRKTPTITDIINYLSFHAGLGDNKGRHFLLGFIENRILVQQPIIRIYVTSHEVGAVTFSVPLEHATYPPVTRAVRKGVIAIQEYPYELHMIGTDYNTKCKLVCLFYSWRLYSAAPLGNQAINTIT